MELADLRSEIILMDLRSMKPVTGYLLYKNRNDMSRVDLRSKRSLCFGLLGLIEDS